MKIVLLWTDWVVLALVLGVFWYGWHVRRTPNLRATWGRVFRDAPALGSAVVLVACLGITLLDSMHFRRALPAVEGAGNGMTAYDTRMSSVLDVLLARLISTREATYSRPLAFQSFTKESEGSGDSIKRVHPRLVYGGAHLKNPETEWMPDVLRRAATGALIGAALSVLATGLLVAVLARSQRTGWRAAAQRVARGETELPWRTGVVTFAGLAMLGGAMVMLAWQYHVLGTDRTGNDVLYLAIKSIRTAFVIGGLATIATLPFAVGLGLMAGYFRGWVDEVIQYLYTVLSSVPNVLLIAACVLMVQVFLDQRPELFETGIERADLKLFILCAILGVTGWATLCRLLRAETMKLRELEFVQAATAFGVNPWQVMARHVFPNVMHLILITTALDFSALILYEAVLSYVGVGVDPSMNSFGGMINLARSEMSRDPVVWWSFAAAFGFMVTLVLAANLFADGVRDAFDPRSRAFKPRVLKKAATA